MAGNPRVVPSLTHPSVTNSKGLFQRHVVSATTDDSGSRLCSLPLVSGIKPDTMAIPQLPRK